AYEADAAPASGEDSFGDDSFDESVASDLRGPGSGGGAPGRALQVAPLRAAPRPPPPPAPAMRLERRSHEEARRRIPQDLMGGEPSGGGTPSWVEQARWKPDARLLQGLRAKVE